MIEPSNVVVKRKKNEKKSKSYYTKASNGDLHKAIKRIVDFYFSFSK